MCCCAGVQRTGRSACYRQFGLKVAASAQGNGVAHSCAPRLLSTALLHLADEQGKPELRELLRKKASLSYVERLSDFHLLLWLSKQPNLDSNDIILLCDAVKGQKPVLEGYRVIIDSIAGI